MKISQANDITLKRRQGHQSGYGLVEKVHVSFAFFSHVAFYCRHKRYRVLLQCRFDFPERLTVSAVDADYVLSVVVDFSRSAAAQACFGVAFSVVWAFVAGWHFCRLLKRPRCFAVGAPLFGRGFHFRGSVGGGDVLERE